MAVFPLHLVTSSTCLLIWLVAANPLPRGVSPDDAHKYACKTKPCKFVCLSQPAVVLDHSAVNDNYCDCEDGSDEPGTPACGGQEKTLFYCPNQNSFPKRIYTAQVDDAICDCCDGSDETRAKNQKRCPNTCLREAQERKVLEQRLQQGLAQQRGITRDAQTSRQTWKMNLNKFKSEQARLDKSLEAAKTAQAVAYAEAEAVAAAKCSGCCVELDQTINDLRAEIANLRSRQEKLIAENTRLHASDGAKIDGGAKQVSEYAKWMADSENAAFTNGDNKVASNDPASANSASGDDSKARDIKVSPAQQQVIDKHSKQQKDIEQQIEKNDKELADVERKFELIPDDKLAFFSLMDKCLEAKLEGYRYKFCLGKRAHQGATLLGAWKSWQGEQEAIFSGGQTCGGGVDRQLVIKFRCSGDEQIVEVSEPRKCQYEAIVDHPGACDKKTMDSIQRARSKVQHPKDEL